MQPSIFTKIINGEVPCYKIYEDELTVAILDIHPISPGHTLVVAKKQVDHFDDLDDENYQALFNTVKLISKRLKEVLSTQRACLRIEGFDIPHAHIHVIPCNKPSDFYIEHRMQQDPDPTALAAMAGRLKIEGQNG